MSRRRHRATPREHTPEAVRSRLAAGPQESYLRDFVYGAIDGTVTTFAIVAGVSGADLEAGIVIILGVANLVADGLSMAVSNYLGTRSEKQRHDRLRLEEEQHVRLVPEGESEEVRQLLSRWDLDERTLETVVGAVTSDRDRWVEFMMRWEHGVPATAPHPWRAAVVTFVAFVVVGFVPLAPFVADHVFGGPAHAFAWSGALTAVAFAAVGAAKATVVGQPAWRAGLETLAVGGAAAGAAFAIGAALGHLA